MGGKRLFKFVSPVIMSSMAAGFCNNSFALAKNIEDEVARSKFGLQRGYCKYYDDSPSPLALREYGEYVDNKKYLDLTLKGAFIALTYGYIWNKDFHKFADRFYAKRKFGKIMSCFVLPPIFICLLLMTLLKLGELCKEIYNTNRNLNNQQITIYILVYIGVYNVGNISDNISVSTQESDTVKEDNDFQVLPSDLGDRGKGYIFSRNLEQKQENERIILENSEFID